MSDILSELEGKVAERYAVLSGIGSGPYEEIDSKRITYYVFGYGAKGCISDTELVRETVDALWNMLENAWPAGETLRWRRKPELRAEDGRIMLTARIGAFSPPTKGGYDE